MPIVRKRIYLGTYVVIDFDHKVTNSSPLTRKMTSKRLYFNYFKDRLVHFNGTAMFSFLEKLGYVLFDNIPYDKILDSYKEFVDIDSRVYTQANLDLLEMLKAADELQNKQMLSKRKITLNTALELAQWLIENDKQTSLTDIHLINYLQTTKRLRDLTDEERKPLIKMTQSSEPMVRAAANILLGDTDVAKYIIENMKNDDKIIFVNFPIYHLLLK